MKSRAVMLASAAICLALDVYAWRGTYTRYFKDDFCSAASTQRNGPIGVVLEFREN